MARPRSPLRLPVRTASGQRLGTVVDVLVDPDTHTIAAYHVKASRMMPDAVQSPLIIHPTQVVDITDKEMVVDDAAIDEQSSQPAALAT